MSPQSQKSVPLARRKLSGCVASVRDGLFEPLRLASEQKSIFERILLITNSEIPRESTDHVRKRSADTCAPIADKRRHRGGYNYFLLINLAIRFGKIDRGSTVGCDRTSATSSKASHLYHRPSYSLVRLPRRRSTIRARVAAAVAEVSFR